MEKEILEKWDNTCIKVLSKEHGAKVIEFWKSVGVNTTDMIGSVINDHYGLFYGVFTGVTSKKYWENKRILTLEEAIAIRDKDKLKTFPREMYCWDSNPIEAKKCTVIHTMPHNSTLYNVMTISSINTYVSYKCYLEVEEYEKLYIKQQTKRLPTIEEVTKWFEENRIFKNKNEFIFRILGVAIKATFPIEINGDHYTIEEFCTKFTDQNGNELYITE